MEKETVEQQLQKIIFIIHQIPIGLVETDLQGTLKQMNAKGVQLLMPLFLQFQLSGSNIFELLEKIRPDLLQQIQQYEGESGTIIQQENYLIELNINQQQVNRFFYFTINKINTDTISFVFDDITELQEKENLIREAIQEKAVEQSKFEMASGVLHDIGNAVVGFGSYINRIKNHLNYSDHKNLLGLWGFLEKNKHHFEPGIGSAKTTAMMDMVAAIAKNQEKNAMEANQIISEQMGIINHISEILVIQRQYIKGHSVERESINIRSIVNDSIAMIMPSLVKKGIEMVVDIPISISKVKGDKTRLMQVFLNLIKNASESIESADLPDKKISISTTQTTDMVEIKLIDTGTGFEKLNAEELFKRGYTSKESGSGIGLYNCRSIIESHQGTLELVSEGSGKGATAILTFKIA
ncbi:MAG: sensor histidine kinase [Sphingobacteriia bacterium]|nr:MAG: sensor histidine kinase [Sphingobacteriia bacterium]TAG29163.1 MAG: sensor histidine kinase [Sphingobacteriia bacterium]